MVSTKILRIIFNIENNVAVSCKSAY